MAFIRGRIDIRGDMLAAIRFRLPDPRTISSSWLLRLGARFAPWRIQSWFQSRRRAAENMRFHYDRSNAFYRQFLGSRMVYSCAYFKDPSWDLEEAQLAKLDYICRKLDLQRGERFLDIGCGWGALVVHAAERYGALATGCTLSRTQFDYAAGLIAGRGLQDRVRIHDKDYRDLQGRYRKIASVGMFEHVGRRRLESYFAYVNGLLDEDGLFLNHGIIRPQLVSDDAGTMCLLHRVFPGGELTHLADVIHAAENAGFEVLDVENLRLHYALTLRAWAQRLARHRTACLEAVDAQTYRTWLLWMAGCSIEFEDGLLEVHQILLAKRSSPYTRRLTRAHMTV